MVAQYLISLFRCYTYDFDYMNMRRVDMKYLRDKDLAGVVGGKKKKRRVKKVAASPAGSVASTTG